MASEPAVLAVQEWMKSRGFTLFGRAFDLTQNSDAAARWFTEQVEDYLRYRDARGL